MNTAQVRKAYTTSESQAKIHPVKLIHMMYERLLQHLELVKEAIGEKNCKARGENLGKAIALLAELNASIKEDDTSEAANFLRGLYSAILTELPKIAIENDVHILKQSMQYVHRLKEIWEQTAMKEYELTSKPVVEVAKPKPTVAEYQGGRGSALGSVSVSI